MIDLAERTPDGNLRWYNSAAQVSECPFPELFEHIPDFERRTLSVSDPDGDRSYVNPQFDVVVRKPFREDSNYIPVGIVSKTYSLVPHKEVLRAVAEALNSIYIRLESIRTELMITEYGERMHASFFLPDIYAFDPGDGCPMALRLELFNSVDGSTQFRALMGWFRFVCSNGLIIGVTKTCLHRRHTGNLGIADIGTVLSQGLSDAEQDRKNLRRWRERHIGLDALGRWVNGPVRETRGFKAATRAFHIARNGYDVEIAERYKNRLPTTIQVRPTNRVPGCPEEASNAFDVSQVLSWLAGKRRDVQEQLEWRQQIPELMAVLIERRND